MTPLQCFAQFGQTFDAISRGNQVSPREIQTAACGRAELFKRHRDELLHGVQASNTVDTTLKRSVLLQTVLVDFRRRLLPLTVLSTVFNDTPLEGDDKIQVPFYDLDATASTSWDAGNGYVAGNTTTDNREITVDKRKYQALAVSSQELARQPFLKVVELAKLKAEKLAADVLDDILSVVTLANYGAAVWSGDASAFDSEDLADLKQACRTWPEMGRSLFLDSAYDAALLKDAGFKNAMNAGSDLAIREGRLFPRVFGFDYIENPRIPSNSENLVGFCCERSGILVATSPIRPTPEVLAAGTRYEVAVDPQLGIAIEMRSFGSSAMDTATHVIECNYGFAKGNGNACKRLCSAE